MKWVRVGRGKGSNAETEYEEETVRSFVRGVVSELGYGERQEDGGERKDRERGTERSTRPDNSNYIAKLSWLSYVRLPTTFPLLRLLTTVPFNDSTHVFAYLRLTAHV